MRIMTVYGPTWEPSEWPPYPPDRQPGSPDDFVFPREHYDMRLGAPRREQLYGWIITLARYMRIDVLRLSLYFRPGEIERATAFYDALQGTGLRACLLYEPWGEAADTVLERLLSVRHLLEHPVAALRNNKAMLYVWRAETAAEVEKWRQVKLACPVPLWVSTRVRTDTWAEDVPVDNELPHTRRIDAHWSYPQGNSNPSDPHNGYRDLSAWPWSVSYTTAVYAPSTKQWSARPDAAAFRAAVQAPVSDLMPAVVDAHQVDQEFVFDELGEWRFLCSRADPMGAVNVVRESAHTS